MCICLSAHGDIEAVRALVGRGEPHRNNHCERLEAEIDHLEKDLQTANKELREMLNFKEELAPELERLKVLVATTSPYPAPRTTYPAISA